MANVNICRGGTPNFRGWFCEKDYPENLPPVSMDNLSGTPPFDSHACGSMGQGYLNISMPLVPVLEDTEAHRWMQKALKNLAAVNDVVFTNWIPLKSYIDSLYIEVKKIDKELAGVKVKPVAYRVTYNEATKEYDYAEIAAFTDELTTAGATHELSIGASGGAEKSTLFARLSNDPTKVPATFGTDIVGDPSYGAVVLGLQVSSGDADKIAAIYRSQIAVYLSAKLLCFECSTQVG